MHSTAPAASPSSGGGLHGYQQLQVIAEHLQALCSADPNNAYLCRLSGQVERTLDKDRVRPPIWPKHINDCCGLRPVYTIPLLKKQTRRSVGSSSD